MITIAYSSKSPKPELIKHFKKSSGYEKGIHVIEKINNGEKSLSEVYNEIINESPNDIIILTHDDIYFDTNAWYNKILRHFEKTDYGILGMAGTTYLLETGKWWENRMKMVGIVNHEADGRKWESKYANNIGNDIKQVVIVDGVFIAIHRGRLKKHFNEEFKGFHFYDLPFCFENHLEGVKVGVMTNVRITHKSIGMTNEQWETNRQFFSKKYAKNLPSKIPFDPKQKIKVLLSCLSFKNFTGSEVYVYELAKSLQNQNCQVTIMSQIGGPLTQLAKKEGIRCVSFDEAPGFKLGDGKWNYVNPQGKTEVSQPTVMYKVAEVDFDIIHAQHTPVVEKILSMYPTIDKICTIHSEVMPKRLEDPIDHESIKRYIAIRPEIKDHLIKKFDIESDQIDVIYNPVDKNKFTLKNSQDQNYVLFVGTIDYLRRETIMDLIDYTKENNKELWLVGEDNSDYAGSLTSYSHVRRFPSTWDITPFLQNCSETAGIQLGRTTIESWMSGKKAWIYKVDSYGKILSKDLTEAPIDMEKFYSQNVAKQMRETYVKVLSDLEVNKRLVFNGRKITPDFSQNWGDLITGKIIKHLTKNEKFDIENVFNVKNPNKKYSVISTGSVMAFTNVNSIVWGTGCIEKNKVGQKPKKIFAVRGPDTRNELIKKGWDCPEVYGDPALLYPKIYNPTIGKKYKIGFIPHYIEYDTNKDLKILHHLEDLGVQIIDICAGEFEFIDQVLECEKIISSSLHGLIISDAYGIPNGRVNVSNKLIGGDFKFIDYYKSVGRGEDLGLQLDTTITLEDINDILFNEKIEIDLNLLLESAPWNDDEYKNIFI